MTYPARGGAVVCLFVFLFATAPVAAPSPSSAVVSRFQASLLETMREAKALGIEGRYRKLRPVIGDIFHLPLMAATATAPYWRPAPAAQRRALLDAFIRMSASSVATLFDDYNNETFEIVRERDPRGPAVLVDTKINRPGKDDVEITYVTAQIGGRWWIIDIIVGGGISELKVRRDEYLSVLKEEGLPGLTRVLSDTADRLLAGKEKATAKGAGR